MSDPTSVAEFVIKRWGGINQTARALGKAVSTVQGWKDSGTIHPRNWPDIQAAALKEGWFDLTARWLGEAHAAQAVRRSHIAEDEASKKKSEPAEPIAAG